MTDVLVIGGGPAGLAAATAAAREGAEVTLLERAGDLGGILNQCVHNGFGLHRFGEELTGPEYAERFIGDLPKTRIDLRLGTFAMSLSSSRKAEVISAKRGYEIISAKAVVLAMGCRERTRGALAIPGTRPAGVYSAGAVQQYMNLEGFKVGKRAVILGSGDIGLIMARRMTLEGASVEGVYEIMPHSGGLTRNIVQCLRDFDIPLHLSHTITEIHGGRRVSGVTVAAVGSDRKPVAGTERFVECDTVLMSVGLIPENELSRGAGIVIDARTNGPVVCENLETSIPGIFAGGNVLHVHDLVDYVSNESERAGIEAARFANNGKPCDTLMLDVMAGENVSYVLPQKLRPEMTSRQVDFRFRVRKSIEKAIVKVMSGGKEIAAEKRNFMAPGEMQTLGISAEILSTMRNDIIFEVNEL